MKLMTEMSHSYSWHYPRAVGFAIEEDDERAQLRHDAAAAHALMLAMRQYEQDYPLSPAVAQDVIQWIEKRADELMREWGFEQEKVTT